MTAVPKELPIIGWPLPVRRPTSARSRATAFTEQSTQKAAWLADVKTEIRQLRDLQPNWDSYGADPISAESIREALSVADRLAGQENTTMPDVSATPEGTVAFGWDVGDWSLDTTIAPDGKIRYAYLDRIDRRRNHEGVFANWRDLAACLNYAF